MFLTSSERVIKRHFMLFIYQNENVSVLGVYICVYVCVCVCTYIVFLGPSLKHIEVPRLGVKSEL